MNSLPVLMYHYISRFEGSINVTPEVFEEHCREMARSGWRGISLPEAEAWFLEGRPLPRRSVLITFDDGFLDNMVHAWPLLERYGHQGVVFAVTDRIASGEEVRPTLRDVWNGTVASDSLPPVDQPVTTHPAGFSLRQDLFMNWTEARLVEQSGILAVAAHTASHLSVYAGPNLPSGIAGDSQSAPEELFHIPRARSRTFYQVCGPQPWGMPLFPEKPFMGGPAFLPSAELVAAVAGLVPQDTIQAHSFFQSPAAVAALKKLIEGFGPERLGRMETAAEARLRMRADLERCATALERELGHPVRSLCWPWGTGSDMARDEARRLGFQLFFTTRSGASKPGDPRAIKRFKVRNKPWPWLRTRLHVYSRPWLARAYARLKG